MQIAQVLAGYSLGGADLLRRAMGKKKPEEMAKQSAIFVDGARRRAASTSSDADAHLRPDGEVRRLRLQQVALGRVRAAHLPDRVPQGALPGRVHGRGAVGGHGQHRQGRDAHRRVRATWASTVLPPDVNDSRYDFAVAERAHHPLRPRRGQGRRRGRGRGADRRARARAAPSASLDDLCRRVDLQKVNRRVLEALIRSGSLDGLGANRATLMASLAAAMQLGEQNARAHAGRAGRHVRPAQPTRGAARRRAATPGAAGVERRGAPRRRARDARPVSDRPSDRAASRPDLPQLRVRIASASSIGDRPVAGSSAGASAAARTVTRRRPDRRDQEARRARAS